MGKLFKILGILLGLILLLLVAAVVILPMVFDPNDYKDEIVSKVQEHTGRQLTIDGDLKLSVFPWLGIDIGAMQLSNAAGFEEKAFAAVKHAAVHVKLMPLLSSQVEVDTIGLDGLVLNLAKQKDGKTNWDDLAKGAEASEEKPEADDNRVQVASLSIGGVNISDAQISWDDRSTGQYFEVAPFNLKSGAIIPGKPVGLEMDLQLKSKAPQLNAKVQLSGTVNVDQAAGTIDVSNLKLTTDAEGEAFPSGSLQAELSAAVSAALNGDTVSVKDLALNSGDLKLSGNLAGAKINTKPVFTGSFKLAEFNLRQWLAAQKVALPETADATVLTRFSAGFDLNNQGALTKLDKLSMVLDDTKLDGDVTLNGAAIGFNLNVDAIDADRYLPPVKEAPAETQPAAKASGDEPLLPIETLRSLNLNGVLSVGKLTIQKLLAEQIQLTVKAKNGKIETGQAIKQFYQGALDGKVNLDVASDTPLIRVEHRLTNLQAGPLLKDLTGDDKLTGTGQFNAKLNTKGNSINAVKKSLGGNLDFKFANGAVKGFNIAQIIRETKAKFQGQTVAASNEPAQTDFSELGGSAVISNGVLTNKDLLAKSPFLRITGEGTVSLVPETLDYTVTPVIVSTEKGQGGEGLDDLKGIPVPVHMTGPYVSPKFSVDWGKVLTGTQKAKVEEKIEEKKEEVKQKLQDKIKGSLGDKLKGFSF